METKFIPSEVEARLYDFWEKNDLFKAKVDHSKKPFSIILPPPNANADLHLGHAMYVYEDVMIRFHKMRGFETLWLPGADHAGIETQFVYEKYLAKEGKSRFDFDRETLFKMIWDFVMSNKGKMENQLRVLGFSLDWSQKKFTMDENIVSIVYSTFERLFHEELVYRAEKLVNYCTHCGTSYSDLEVEYEERIDPLYYIKYGPFTIATVRPETKFRDTALAVNPKDKRYKDYLGKTLDIPGLLGPIKMTVIADDEVDPKFGTGIMKVTPAHDPHDFELGKKYNLPVTPIIDFKGRMDFSWFLEDKNADPKYLARAQKYHGQKVAAARKMIAEDMKEEGLLLKVKEDYSHRVGTCYRCHRVLEPLPKEQWFIKVKPLADKAKEMVTKGEIQIYPKRFTKQLIRILDNFIDWNISRQIVWGIRIPAYQCQSTKKWFVDRSRPSKCAVCGTCNFIQDEDTFDTWFSSAQWPFATLQATSEEFFNYFYPTTVMETGYDILRAWVARMIMMGAFVTDKPPFKNVYLHGMVRDRQGQKMSKSKGNVINPLEMVQKYGSDALRAALIFGSKAGNDVVLSEDKIIGMRNFSNKIWNIGRFIWMNEPENQKDDFRPQNSEPKEPIDWEKTLKKMKKELESEKKKYVQQMEKYNFSQAIELVYQFLWHSVADIYIEELKDELRNGNIKVLDALKETYFDNLKMLHPFMPFVSEAVWQTFHGQESSLLKETL